MLVILGEHTYNTTIIGSVKNSVQAGLRGMQMYIHWSVHELKESWALAPIQVGLCAATLRSHDPYEKMSCHWVTQVLRCALFWLLRREHYSLEAIIEFATPIGGKKKKAIRVFDRGTHKWPKIRGFKLFDPAMLHLPMHPVVNDQVLQLLVPRHWICFMPWLSI
jgi:hypothetical protein